MSTASRAARPAVGACGAPGPRTRSLTTRSYAGKLALAGRVPTAATGDDGYLTEVIPYQSSSNDGDAAVIVVVHASGRVHDLSVRRRLSLRAKAVSDLSVVSGFRE